MGETDDQKPAGLRESLYGGAGFGHLHQRQNTLLHPGPAAGGEEDEGQFVLLCFFGSPGDFLSQSHTHTAHKEAAVHHAHNDPMAADAAFGSDDAFHKAGALLLAQQLFAVAGKMERVPGREIPVQFPEAVVIQNGF